jgi:cell division protein FtsL
MTIITPYQRQLKFNRDFLSISNHHNKFSKNIFKNRSSLFFYFSIILFTFSILSLIFLGAASINFSSKIRTVSKQVEENKKINEELLIKQSNLLSLKILNDYANDLNLSQAAKINYLSFEKPIIGLNKDNLR